MTMYVKHADDVDKEEISVGANAYRQVLIGPSEGPNFAMRRFVIGPGGHFPRHTNTVEHEQFVLSGRAQISIGDETFEVSAGNVVFIPAGVPHWYKTLGDAPFEFLCVVPNKEDQIELCSS